jgi:hypothetical protein
VDVGSSQETTALLLPNGTVTVMSDGKLVTTGGILSASSMTRTVNDVVTELPAGSAKV